MYFLSLFSRLKIFISRTREYLLFLLFKFSCWQNYVDYFKCINARGEDFAPCKQFYRAYHSLCPNEWVSSLIYIQIISGEERIIMEAWERIEHATFFSPFDLILTFILFHFKQIEKWDTQREEGTNPSNFEVQISFIIIAFDEMKEKKNEKKAFFFVPRYIICMNSVFIRFFFVV